MTNLKKVLERVKAIKWEMLDPGSGGQVLKTSQIQKTKFFRTLN